MYIDPEFGFDFYENFDRIQTIVDHLKKKEEPMHKSAHKQTCRRYEIESIRQKKTNVSQDGI